MQKASHLRCRLLVPPGDGAALPAYLMTLLKNIESLGFMRSVTMIATLRTCSDEQFDRIHDVLTPTLQKMVDTDYYLMPHCSQGSLLTRCPLTR